MYAVHLRLIGKLVVESLLVISETFSPGAFVLSQFTRLTNGQMALQLPIPYYIQCSAVTTNNLSSKNCISNT